MNGRYVGYLAGDDPLYGFLSRIIRDRIKRQLDEAEGYLMLELPQRALTILERRSDWATMQFEASFLTRPVTTLTRLIRLERS